MLPDKLEFWIDLNLPPAMAVWLNDEFNVKAESFSNLGFEFSSDVDVFVKHKKEPK